MQEKRFIQVSTYKKQKSVMIVQNYYTPPYIFNPRPLIILLSASRRLDTILNPSTLQPSNPLRTFLYHSSPVIN